MLPSNSKSTIPVIKPGESLVDLQSQQAGANMMSRNFASVEACIKSWDIDVTHVLLAAIGRAQGSAFKEDDAASIITACFSGHIPNIVPDNAKVVQHGEFNGKHWILIREKRDDIDIHGEAHILGKKGRIIVHSPFWNVQVVTYQPNEGGPNVRAEIGSG